MQMFETYIKNDRHRTLVDKAGRIAAKVEQRVHIAEASAQFPQENINDLRAERYLSLTLPTEYNGEALSLYEFLLMQERLAMGDGATALSIGWHLGIVKELAEDRIWENETFDWFAREVADKQILVNRIASEKATGSPTRGGVPETIAKREGDHYLITGRKTFSTMASVLDYFIVSAYVEDQDTVGSFLIKSDQAGVSIDKTWDTLGMRGTGSDDVVFNQVKVNETMLVELNKQANTKKAKGWLLHIPACYLGIAMAARNDAIDFAKNFQPNSLKTPIAEVPHIQQKIGEIDLKLMQARCFMYQVAQEWDQCSSDQRQELSAELAATKTIATNIANEVVDIAMRIVGGRGLSKAYRFEQYYRDVRAGLHNPPMDDMVIQILAKRAISE
ncbi:acyl-CoA dehydrogenase family protein [Amphibacillus cookii]|uniref:acyl-CoA dehydrogenase family protein n=1 Tax=Amphibacillus cookii TaxID=767787 RepID=UPI00195B9B20|nr:acyl-CoA dehydrogenase family protein [Amphibacillus cookii]MBM7541477.1 alkylation response protein AidB-like acyl-CoA dehydrogenase [Amphibacillus cookii]